MTNSTHDDLSRTLRPIPSVMIPISRLPIAYPIRYIEITIFEIDAVVFNEILIPGKDGANKSILMPINMGNDSNISILTLCL